MTSADDRAFLGHSKGLAYLGVYYVGAAGGNYLTGALGGLFDHMSIQNFWLMHAGIAAAVLAFLALSGGVLNRLLQRPPLLA